MFQYAFGKAMAVRTNSELWIDVSFLRQNNQTKGVFVARDYELSIFPGITDKVLEFEQLYENRWLKKVKRWLFHRQLRQIVEKGLSFNETYLDIAPPVLYDGYWQHQRYFSEFENEIREAFNFSDVSAVDAAFRFLNSIRNEPVSVAVHVRRGDYLNDLILQHHGICSKSYYLEAFRRLHGLYPEAKYFLFSDDPAWVRSEMAAHLSNYEVIEGNNGQDAWKDMYLMSCCTHQVIANSSFSWWAAWLNRNKSKMVIAPSDWFANPVLKEQAKEVCPPSWIRISNQ